jgi:hypothetical protein
VDEAKQDTTNQIAVTIQDVETINRLLAHFNLPRSKEYNDAYENYKSNPEDQGFTKTMILETAKTMREAKGKNEMLDNIFADIFVSCDKISYDMQFDLDLEDIVGVDPTNPDPHHRSDSSES